MPKQSKFSIWDDCIQEIINGCLTHEEYTKRNIYNFQEKDLVNFFYTKGLADFTKAEEYAIDEATLEYLKELRKMPPFFSSQILGYKFIAFQALRKSFMEEFIWLAPIINEIYDFFVTLAINDNMDFFKLEALARTKRSNYFNINLNTDISNARLIIELDQLKDQAMDLKLIMKIDQHVIYMQKVMSGNHAVTSKITVLPLRLDGHMPTLFQAKNQTSATVPLLPSDSFVLNP